MPLPQTFDGLLQKHVRALRLVILTADTASQVFAGLHPGIMGKLLGMSCQVVLGIIDKGITRGRAVQHHGRNALMGLT